MIPKHAQVMGNRIRSICHYKVMPFQPVSLQVTDVNVFLRKKTTDFPLGVKMPRSAKDKPGNFLFLKLCVCVWGGGGVIMHYLCCQCVLKHAYESVRMTNRAV